MATNEPSTSTGEPLRRVERGRLVAGVATGLAHHLDVDVSIVRLVIVAFTLLGGAGVPLYAAAWLFVPEQGAAESVAAAFLHRHELA